MRIFAITNIVGRTPLVNPFRGRPYAKTGDWRRKHCRVWNYGACAAMPDSAIDATRRRSLSNMNGGIWLDIYSLLQPRRLRRLRRPLDAQRSEMPLIN